MRNSSFEKIVFILIAFSTAVIASPISQGYAHRVAGIFVAAHPGFRPNVEQSAMGWEPFSVVNSTLVEGESGEVLAYVFDLRPRGYVAVSADTDIEPVIAYSVEGDFVFDESPDNLPLRMIERDMALRIEAKPFTDSEIIRKNNALWHSYLSGDKSMIESLSTASITGPWLDTNWGQSAPFNNLCPMDPGTDERSVTGCVATATCQIVDYWEYPYSVTFNSGDSYWSEITSSRIWVDAVTASFSDIDYRGAGRYPDNATIAELMFACGVALEMQYSSEGSSSDTRHVPHAIVYKFDYAHADGYVIMTTGFFDTVQANVLKAQPVELGIGGLGVGGHAIVCDGYDDSDLYHLNMGWSGYYNGWYSLPSGMPADFTIVGHQATNIYPPIITRRPPVNLRGKTKAGGYIELEWHSPFNITEPVLAYHIYRRGFYDATYDLIGSIAGTTFVDTTIEELTGYSYAVSADYSAGESDLVEISLYSGIIGGWVRNFGGAGDQVAYCVAPAPGFGCVAVGYSMLPGSDRDGYIVRTVAGSSPIWYATLDGGGEDCLYSVVEAPDSCFVVAGATDDGGDIDFWLVKLDDNGDTVWTRRLGSTDDETALSVAATSDGGYILAGYSYDGISERGYAIKTDSGGNVLWSKVYPDDTRLNSVVEIGSGGYVYTGQMSPGPLGQKDVLIIRTDSSGDTIWTRTYGGTYDDVGNSIVEAGGGGFVVAGKSKSFGMPIFYSLLIMKISSTGDPVWTRTFVDMGDFEANSVCRKTNGNFLAAGSAKIVGNAEIYTIEVDSDGDSVDARIFGTDGSDIAYSAIELADSGVVIAGRTFQTDNIDFWLLKIGGDLISPVEEYPTALPKKIDVFAYPNPFNSAVRISVETLHATSLRIEIFDLAGRRVAQLPSPSIPLPAGEGRNSFSLWEKVSEGRMRAEFTWQPEKSVGSGVYLVRARIGGESVTKRVVYLK